MSLALNRIREQVGRWDLVVAGAGALGLLAFFLHLAPLQRENARLERQLSAVEPGGPGKSITTYSPDAHRFLQSLPNDRQRSDDIAQLPVLARKHGLQLLHLGFEEADPQGGAVTTLTVRMTVEGPYLSIRGLINGIWARMPGAAISAFRLNRSDDAQGKLQAHLEVLYHSRVSSLTSVEPAASSEHIRPLPADAGPRLDPFGFSPAPPQRTQAHNAADNQPPMPFTYGGSYRSAGSDVYLLMEGDNVHRVRLGETLAGEQFRLDKADLHRLELVHLPSSSRYTLLTGNLAQ